jgi:hypothetical protein
MDNDDINRRQFPRLELDPPAMAYDEGGRELGTIGQTSGGGMLLVPKPELVDEMNVGQTIKVTVIEKESQTKNVIDVMIRYNDGERIGLEFVTGKFMGKNTSVPTA